MKTRNRRAERVADLIRQELSMLLERQVKDPRIGFVTVTSVDLSADLQVARVSVSVLGNQDRKKQALEGLAAAQNFLRHQLAQRLDLRYVPNIVFQLDRSAEYEERIEELIRRTRSQE